jgi:hypothetical protein
MAETSNISKMAEIISKEIFATFKWEKVGPDNVNWSCQHAHHTKKTHPSDVVFCYSEPYRQRTTYVNCDLKSYAKGTITADSIRKSIESLALSIECANVSPDWQKNYLKYNDKNAEIIGLLFIYNHDGLYDGDFDAMMRQLNKAILKIPKNVKIFVLGPKDVCYLKTIVNDIKIMDSDEGIGGNDKRCFYFPDLVIEKVLKKDFSIAATLEVLSGPWQILKYKIPSTSEYGLVFYYKHSGKDVEEFLYIIDYLFHYQLLQNCSKIKIKLPNGSAHASAVFDHAIKEYAGRYEGQNEIVARLNSITFEHVTNIVTQFHEIQIGMNS